MGSKTYSPIARTEIARLRRDLDALVERCESHVSGTEVQADAYQYAYVRLAGFLEQSLLWVGRAVVHRLAGAEARAFGLSRLDRSRRNPTDDEIVGFVRRFDARWATELVAWFDLDGRGGRINSLVGIRNGIAHGTSFGGSARGFADYYVVVQELVDWLIVRFDPTP
jgi:hypothetical protein